ncbi:uncharacterized protein LOC106161097 [Lingula anatina]|uniref:Uncharacterized protein LOC106161097 n=1 Tax=Lingula anatina TaxID=7574 RepID=A0A1S3I7Q6_LINAN|nr:uncharacterized protein LOC106161097 [Lingula anatina]|eukprot:XP_013393409.1 uncharacterized protein LOC106161097 [Lingula anatina]
MGTVYKITKQLSGSHNNNHSAPVKDRNGNTMSTECEQAARWVQHFKEVLNHPGPSEPANSTPTDGILDINTDPPTREEVRNAIIAMKNGKASGIDNIHAEMLKADVGMATNLLTDLFSTIWEKDTIPDDWTKGLICYPGQYPDGVVPSGFRCTSRLYLVPNSLPCNHRLGHEKDNIRQTQRHPVDSPIISQPEDLDFADDLALLSSKHSHLQEKTDRLSSFAAQAGLAISTIKTQVMCINNSTTAPITVSGKPLESVDDFTYLGSLISKDNGAQKDIRARLGKAQS